MNLLEVTTKEVFEAIYKLNDRPKKRLGLKLPMKYLGKTLEFE